eukprot:scaffold63577_cov81-Phaeocystis_antarctica.AAC.1
MFERALRLHLASQALLLVELHRRSQRHRPLLLSRSLCLSELCCCRHRRCRQLCLHLRHSLLLLLHGQHAGGRLLLSRLALCLRKLRRRSHRSLPRLGAHLISQRLRTLVRGCEERLRLLRVGPLRLLQLLSRARCKLLGLRRQPGLSPGEVAHRGAQAQPEAGTLERVPPPARKCGVGHPRCKQGDQVGQTLRRRNPKGDTHLLRHKAVWGRMSEPSAPGAGSREAEPQPQATRQNLGSARLHLATLCPYGPN